VYGRLGYLQNYKKKNPLMKIALCGCMMQEPEVVENIKKHYKFVDIVFGTHNIFKFAEILCNNIESGSQVIDIWKKGFWHRIWAYCVRHEASQRGTKQTHAAHRKGIFRRGCVRGRPCRC
jgi:tRNA A37 methylthiotransferase MiaB